MVNNFVNSSDWIAVVLGLAFGTLLLFHFLRIKHLNQKYREQLEAASNDTKEALAEKDIFLANVSHELRTPMNAILGLSHIVLQSKLTPEQRKNIVNIKHAADMLLSITNDLLDFSKIHAGKLSIEPIPVDTGKLFNQIADVITYSAVHKGIELIFNIDNRIPDKIIVDGLRLQQVLMNLLSNAVKFTEKGRVILSVDVHQDTEKNQSQIVFSVSDTGIGLTNEQKEKLFHAFTQADNSISRKYGGTGLGLAISKQLVEMMGGELEFSSVYREGSSFYFSIPLVTENEEDNGNNKLLFRLLGGKGILILDSSAESAKSLASILAPYKAVIKIAASTQEFIKYIQWDHFDVICIDSALHFEKLEEMNPQRQSCKVISLTYRTLDITLPNDFSYDKTIEKPYIKSTVLAQFSELFSKNIYVAPTVEKVDADDLKQIEGSHILLVEDNEGNQMVIEGLLEGTGIEIDTAVNGQKGVEKLFAEPEKYDLILMDINMPVMDGYAATSIIREYEKYDAIPIIAMTANITESDIKKSQTFGMQKHLNKPIDVNDFYATLLQYIPAKQTKATESDRTEKQEKKLPEVKSDVEFEEIDGIDFQQGLSRVNGNTAVYIKILEKFAEVFDGIGPDLKKMATEGRLKEGRDLAHNLKGLSGNIGAMKLYELAKDLEEAFQENRSDTLELIQMIQADLDPMIDTIKNLKSKRSDFEKRDKIAVSEAELKSDLLALLQSARKKKAHEVKQLAKKLESYDVPKDNKAFVASILKAVSQYRFDKVVNEISLLYPNEGL